jgi:hypothetical protein
MVDKENKLIAEARIRPGFLQECANCIAQTLGDGALENIPGKFPSQLSARWRPSLKHGMPFYDSRWWAWDFSGRAETSFDLALKISSDGNLVVCDHEKDPVSDPEYDPEGPILHLGLKLKNSSELTEVLELFQQLTPENCDRTHFQELPWASVVQDVFATIPVDKDIRLVKFSWASWEAKWPKLLEPFKAFYQGDSGLINNMQYSTWRDWVERHANLQSMQFSGPLKDDDLVFNPTRGFLTARTVINNTCDVWMNCEPQLVFRLKLQQSRMYFLDVLENMNEGEMFLQTIFKNPEKLPQLLGQTKVTYPSTRLLQIRLSVELRVAQIAYEEKVHSLMTKREPAEKIHEFYHLRTKHVQLLHTGFLEELEATQHPLPFLIEYPLRRFSRAQDDRLVKIKCGQRLQNLLAKLPLFLALEESSAKPECKLLTAPIEAKLFGKPASDGTLAECLRDLQKLVHEQKVHLPWFGRLIERYRQDGEVLLAKLIEPLNRYKHPPYDDRTFLKALEVEIPVLINLFRECLEGLLFIAPESQNQQGANHVVSARVLMGFDVDFLKRDLVVTAPFEAFPAGELVVVDSKLDRALVLSRFFKSQPIHTISLDIGVFDRVVHGHPEYVFIRGLDQEDT